MDTIPEIKLSSKYKKRRIWIVSRSSKQFKTGKLRKLGKIRKIWNQGGYKHMVQSMFHNLNFGNSC